MNAIQANWDKPQARPQNKGGEHYLIEKKGGKKGRVGMSKVHWRRARVQGVCGFSLAECDGFPLAGLLLGKEKNLPTSCQGMWSKLLVPVCKLSCKRSYMLESSLFGGPHFQWHFIFFFHTLWWPCFYSWLRIALTLMHAEWLVAWL